MSGFCHFGCCPGAVVVSHDPRIASHISTMFPWLSGVPVSRKPSSPFPSQTRFALSGGVSGKNSPLSRAASQHFHPPLVTNQVIFETDILSETRGQFELFPGIIMTKTDVFLHLPLQSLLQSQFVGCFDSSAQFKLATIFYVFTWSKFSNKIYTTVAFCILFGCSPLITTKAGKRTLKELDWPSTPAPSTSNPSGQAADLHRSLSRPCYTLKMADKKTPASQVSQYMNIFSISPEFWRLLSTPGSHYSRQLWRFNQCSPWLKFSVRHQSAL